MESTQILSADMLDLLFDGKNKEYGAYDLRKTYNKRISIAVAGMATVCLLFFLSQIFANDKNSNVKPIFTKDYTLAEIKEIKQIKPVLPQMKMPQVTKAAMKQLTAPLLVKNLQPEEQLSPIEEYNDVQIGLQNQDGIKSQDYIDAPVGQSTRVVAPLVKPDKDESHAFVAVEKEARFPGGLQGWKKFLERNLNNTVATDEGAPIGRYTVKVQFTVDKDGTISNVEAIEIPKECPGCGAEAVKVIKKGPNWEPAIQNGNKVIYKAVQYITFEVAE